MRPVVLQKAGIRDEGALDGLPLVQVFRAEERLDQYRGEQKDEEEIEKESARLRESMRDGSAASLLGLAAARFGTA